MKEWPRISGFADEISSEFEEQLRVVTELGMRYISLRSADGKGIADYTAGEVQERLLPKLRAYGVQVSSIGSPIGKIPVDDPEAFERQKGQLEELCRICQLLDCRYIRMFSFFMPEGSDPDEWRGTVLEKLAQFLEIAKKYDVVLLHENEKDIYGDIGRRCLELMRAFPDPHFRAAFDFANFVQCGEDPIACWDLLAPYISYIHIKDAVSTDNENVVCGTGEGRIPELLARAIQKEGYDGFLTLEPHLVIFDSLATLETASPEHVIRKNKAKNGAEGYAMQYRALLSVLQKIGVLES